MTHSQLTEWAETRLWDSVRGEFLHWAESQPMYLLDKDPWWLFHVWNLWTGKLDKGG